MSWFSSNDADDLVDARRDLDNGKITEREFTALADKAPVDVVGEAMALYGGHEKWGR